jgi:SAM-dependent methyltransferase
MDLKEIELCKNQVVAHPWETTRVWNISKILKSCDVLDLGNILDVGCSNGETADQLLQNFFFTSLVGIDVCLTDDFIKALSVRYPDRRYLNSWDALPKQQQFDTILAFDVLEHVENDDQLMTEELLPRLRKGGVVMITVPAFPLLFSHHDEILGHYRRYTVASLTEKLERCSLKVQWSGYFFFSLLAVRFLQRIARRKSKLVSWKRGRRFTEMIEWLLKCDGYLVFFFLRLGIRLPGLSVWAYCVKEK